MQRVPRFLVRTAPLAGYFGVWDRARGSYVTFFAGVWMRFTRDEQEAGAVADRKNAEAEAQVEQAIV